MVFPNKERIVINGTNIQMDFNTLKRVFIRCINNCGDETDGYKGYGDKDKNIGCSGFKEYLDIIIGKETGDRILTSLYDAVLESPFYKLFDMKNLDMQQYLKLIKSNYDNIIAIIENIKNQDNTKNPYYEYYQQNKLQIDKSIPLALTRINPFTKLLTDLIKKYEPKVVDSKKFVLDLTTAIQQSIPKQEKPIPQPKSSILSGLGSSVSISSNTPTPLPEVPQPIIINTHKMNKDSSEIIIDGQIDDDSNIVIDGKSYPPGSTITIGEGNNKEVRIIETVKPVTKTKTKGGKFIKMRNKRTTRKKKKGGTSGDGVIVTLDTPLDKEHAENTHISIAEGTVALVKPRESSNCISEGKDVPDCSNMTAEDKKKTYRGFALLLHPDKNIGCKDPEQPKRKMQELNESICKQYNEQPQPGQPQPGKPQPGQPQPGQSQPGQPQPGQPQPGQPQPGQQGPQPQNKTDSKTRLTTILSDTKKPQPPLKSPLQVKQNIVQITSTIDNINNLLNDLCDIEVKIDNDTAKTYDKYGREIFNCKPTSQIIQNDDFTDILNATPDVRTKLISKFVAKASSVPEIKNMVIDIFKALQNRLIEINNSSNSKDKDIDILTQIIKMVIKGLLENQ